MDLPDGTMVTYESVSTGDLHDAETARTTNVKVGATTVASYAYNGVGGLVGIEYPEADVYQHRYGTTSGSYQPSLPCAGDC